MYLDYDPEKTYVIDIETDDLDATKIWIMCWKNVGTGEVGECTKQADYDEFFSGKEDCSFVGHNILKFDAPVLNELCNTSLSFKNCIDTLVLSTLYSPSNSNGHSLESWGEQLGKEKIEFTDFASGLTDEMREYCHRDVEITCQLFQRLVKTLKRIGFTERSIWIQHRWTVILERQRKHGFFFNGRKAIELYQKVRHEEEELQEDIRSVFPAKRVLIGVRQRRKKNGDFTEIYKTDCDRFIIVEKEAENKYEAYEDVPFNIGSPVQRTEKLLALGWEPEEFTKTGLPKPFDKGDLSPSLYRFLEGNDIPEVHMIAEWMALNGRGNMINNWLENWDEDDGCIHGKLFTADTLRCRHQAPNTANVPAVRVDKEGSVLLGRRGYYTYEARDLWCARPGRYLVGTDAAGLELRMLAHYLNRPAFTEQVVQGDPHQYNADTVGITRPQAKTLIYAIMYGAAAAKIAKTLNISVKDGGDIRTQFLERLGLKGLIDSCKKEQKAGRISLVDGSQVICPSPHSALNYKLQGGGARVMSLGAIFLEQVIQMERLDSNKVGDIHDEWQYDVSGNDADRHAEVSVEAIRRAGEILSLAVPLDGTAKKGLTWAETH